MFANTQLAGMDVATPNLCWVQPPGPVPPVLTPFTNQAMSNAAVGFCPKVLLLAAPAHTLATTIPVSIEIPPAPPGIGQLSGTFMGPSRHTTSSAKVLWAGAPATRLSSSSSQNNNNCVGARVVPSQPKVTLLG